MKDSNRCRVSSKGLALLAAIEVGWCPSIEGGRDISTFNRFWEIYQESLRKQMSDPTQESVQLGVEDRDENADSGQKERKTLKIAICLLVANIAYSLLLSLLSVLQGG